MPRMDRRVQIDTLIIRDFRNLERVRVESFSDFNVICGQNGMGKTNLLEAIYLLGALRSFRTGKRGELIRHGAEASKVQGYFGGATAGLRCELMLTPGMRRMAVNDQPTRKPADHFAEVPMVLFHPGHLDLVRGGPEGRRRFMDRALFQADRSYPDLYDRYRRALAGRNRLIRQRDGGQRTVGLFEEQMAVAAEGLITARKDLVSQLAPDFTSVCGSIGCGQQARLDYRPGMEGDKATLAATWEKTRERDRRLGYTAAGPHSDDLFMELEGRPARRFGSQGQQRTLALSLKVAETRMLRKATGRIPLLLLDDVSSELDRDRNDKLFAFLFDTRAQVFVTTTHGDHILLEQRDRKDFRVDRGVISAS